MARRIFGQFLNYYNHILNKHKYPVQIVTGGALWFTGDVLAQTLVQSRDLFAVNDGKEEEEKDKGTNDSRKSIKLDWNRVGRMTCYGLVISAPVYAFWYSYLDRWSHRFFSGRPIRSVSPDSIIIPGPLRHFIQRFPKLGEPFRVPIVKIIEKMPDAATRRVWEIIGFKLAADCFLFDPAYLALFFSATNAMEGRGLKEIGSKLKTDLFPTYLVDIAVWFPIQTINFRWIPVVYQALFVQSCNVGWNAYLSFVQHRDGKH